MLACSSLPFANTSQLANPINSLSQLQTCRPQLLEGTSGVELISRFDASDFPTKFAAQARTFLNLLFFWQRAPPPELAKGLPGRAAVLAVD